jgi:hypothetical protein
LNPDFHHPIDSRPSDQVTLQFSFRETTIEMTGIVRNLVRDSKAIGIQFLKLNPDLKKDMSYFIESLKGEGYVQ